MGRRGTGTPAFSLKRGESVLDRKLFVFSVVSWFLALGLGIMVGAATGARGFWDANLDGWLEQLEVDMVALREEQRNLRQGLEQKDRVLTGLFEDAVRDRLGGARVSVVDGQGSSGPGIENLWWFLGAAGAVVSDERGNSDMVILIPAGDPEDMDLSFTSQLPVVMVDNHIGSPFHDAWKGVARDRNWQVASLTDLRDGFQLIKALEDLLTPIEGGTQDRTEN